MAFFCPYVDGNDSEGTPIMNGSPRQSVCKENSSGTWMSVRRNVWVASTSSLECALKIVLSCATGTKKSIRQGETDCHSKILPTTKGQRKPDHHSTFWAEGYP